MFYNSFVVKENTKFRAETIRLGGIAFLAPIGKVVMDLFELIDQYGSLKFIVFFIYSLGLAYVGLVFIARSYDIISCSEERQKDYKWKI